MKLFGQKEDIKKHKFLFLSIILSLLISVVFVLEYINIQNACFYRFFIRKEFNRIFTDLFFTGGSFLIPTILTFFVYHIGVKLSDKFPVITKIISAIINLIILFLQIIFSVFIIFATIWGRSKGCC